ncbi:transcription factor [Exidia glandulosa HHB12029]|uniref:Transcription factor n=1 Tax=Exidia glandulosa HHB12029 TaxID=1314781 RepID=A0A166BKG5_EXIGL|nr:transcription factor [Exidia glandulosa HHB12029]
MADEDEMMRMMGISGFGKAKQAKKVDVHTFDKSLRVRALTRRVIPTPNTASQPAPAPKPATPPFVPEVDSDDDDEPGPKPAPQPAAGPSSAPAPAADFVEPEFDPDENGDDDDDDAPLFPITHELVLKDHSKVLSAIAMEPSGARMVSGAHDYELKMWDFGGMDERAKPFKSWEPAGSYYVNDIKYSQAADMFLVISATMQAKLYDREGEEKGMFMKGDPYLRDMHHTAGHVAEMTSCAWHPYETQQFITSSADSTIRIWDVENRRKQKTVIVVKSKERGARTKVTHCAYSYDGGIIGGACLDGALHMWNSSSNFVRPNLSIEGAHTKGTDTGSVVFAMDGRTVITRGGDDTVKTWDLRAFKKPVATRSGLSTLYPGTNAILSPDEKYIVTGSGATLKGGAGKLHFLKRDTLEVVQELEMLTSVVKVYWHSKINQLVVGLSNGQMSMLYSPLTSVNGAKMVVARGPRKKPTIEDAMQTLLGVPILTPGAQSALADGDESVLTGKRKRERGKIDPRKLRRPELPVSGPGRGGRVGASATQHVVKNLVRDTTRDEDPREALLKYAQLADTDPRWTKAWRETQPKPVFQQEEEKDSDEERG